MTKVFMLLMVLILELFLLCKKDMKMQKFYFKKNYRSTKPILDLATKVIEYNERVYEKKIRSCKKRDRI